MQEKRIYIMIYLLWRAFIKMYAVFWHLRMNFAYSCIIYIKAVALDNYKYES